MATGLQVWSQAAASNSNADSSVNWAEGMAPSAVNDSARAEMASAAKWRDDNNGTLVTTGSSVAFTVTTNQGSTANTDGYTLTVKFHATSDASGTLARDTAPAAAMQIVAGTNLTGGEFPAGTIQRFTYVASSTAWVKQGHEALAAGAVGTTSISDGAVTGAKIADATINSTNLVDATIATTKLSTGAVTLAKLAAYGANATGTIAANLSTSAASPTTFALGPNLGLVNGKFDAKYGPKAWAYCTVSGSSVTVVASFNVASIARNSGGKYTATYSNALTDANYVLLGSAKHTSDNVLVIMETVGGTRASSALDFCVITAAAGSQDPASFSIAIFGN